MKNGNGRNRCQTGMLGLRNLRYGFVFVLLCLILISKANATETTYTTQYVYDPQSNNIVDRFTPNSATDPIHYDYDALNRIHIITYPDGKTVTYEYDGNGNRTSMLDAHGTTTYSYDRFNKLRAVQYPGIIPIYYEYDKSGNLTKITYPSGETVTYEYDTSNRLWHVTDVTGVTTYEYNNLTNNLFKKTLPNSVYTSYEYDLAKRITDVVNKKSDNSLISSYHYTFDNNSNITQVDEIIGTGPTKTTIYHYDELNRLKTVTIDNVLTESYTYDDSGNRLTKNTPSGTITYKYDGDNRLIKSSSNGLNTLYFYDKSGNLIKKMSATETVTYAYDYENRLILYSDGIDNVSFEYDGDGNRISKTVNGIKTKYINHISPIPQVLLETTDQNSVTARYTYADARLNQTNYGATSFYVYDKPGKSTTALIDSSQTTLNSYAYDSFGIIQTDNETTLNNFKYDGEQFDDETGLVYLRHRYYDSETGRFLNKDPFPGYVKAPQTINPYPYVGNNPVNRMDPSGLDEAIVLGGYVNLNFNIGRYVGVTFGLLQVDDGYYPYLGYGFMLSPGASLTVSTTDPTPGWNTEVQASRVILVGALGYDETNFDWFWELGLSTPGVSVTRYYVFKKQYSPMKPAICHTPTIQ